MSGIEIADICVHTLDQGQLTTTDSELIKDLRSLRRETYELLARASEE